MNAVAERPGLSAEAGKIEYRSATAPPLDRLIRLVANLVDHEGCFTSVEPWEGLARWNETCADWLDERGMSIRMYWDSDMIVHEWSEAPGLFVLIGSGPLVSERPHRTGLLELPAPAWHTTDPWLGEFEHALGARIEDMTPAELFALLDEHTRFIRAWMGMSEWDFEGLDWRNQKGAERPVLNGGSLQRSLSSQQRHNGWESSNRVEQRIEAALLNHYRVDLKKRSRAGQKAAHTRKMKTLWPEGRR